MSEQENSYDYFMNQFNSSVIKSGREKSQISLIAVSKKQSVEKIRQVYLKGQKNFGENYVQEALNKQLQIAHFSNPASPADSLDHFSNQNIIWHFIGSLQKNKVKQIVGKFDLIHSVDSLDLAKKISEYAMLSGIEQKCLLQVNIGEELSKGGFLPEKIIDQVDTLFDLPHICWQGIMTMPPITTDETLSRKFLKSSKEIFDQIKKIINDNKKKEWIHLSMGTSHDFTLAIEEGATMIRIGTLIFGERNN